MADERLPARFSPFSQFWSGGQESASKPPQAICKPYGQPKNETDRVNDKNST